MDGNESIATYYTRQYSSIFCVIIEIWEGATVVKCIPGAGVQMQTTSTLQYAYFLRDILTEIATKR